MSARTASSGEENVFCGGARAERDVHHHGYESENANRGGA